MNHTLRASIIIPVVTVLILIIYGLLVFWILPTHIPADKLSAATGETQLALTIATTVTGLGFYIAQYLDSKNL